MNFLLGLTFVLLIGIISASKKNTGNFTSPDKTNADYNYGEVLKLSLLFYEAQRCGKLPINNRINWRADSFLNDGSDVGVDLTGGYFDAGDHVKFNFPGAGFTTLIGWGLLDYKAGYDAAGEYSNGLAAFKWSLDYMIKCHPSPNIFWAQVGNGTIDHKYWGRPEDWPSDMIRPAFKIDETHPGSDLAAEAAASFAVGYLVFKDNAPAYAEECLRHAKELYNFANKFRGRYSDAVNDGFYGSTNFGDELLWAAAWMYRVTMEQSYLTDAAAHWSEFGLGYRPGGFSWDNKLAGAQVLLAKFAKTPEYIKAATDFCYHMRNNATRTPKGLVFLSEWGSLRSIATVLLPCLQAADAGIDTQENRAFAKQQIDYMLGDGGRSYVVGYGNNPPVRPHHRASSCPDLSVPCNVDTAVNNPGPNPHTLYGALVGGPDVNDFYEDKRDDYVKNEVAVDYNAGFQSVLAALHSLRTSKLI